MTIDFIRYYKSACALGYEPSLLEFKHPKRATRLQVCSIKPKYTLEVTDGRLYRDGKHIGHALVIFDYLHVAAQNSQSFFPSFIGFFSYEFARYFDKPYHQGARKLPDACFKLYEQGLVIEDGEILHHDPITMQPEECTTARKPQELRPVVSKLEFLHAIEQIKQRIRAGDVYQVNLSTPYRFDSANLRPIELYQSLGSYNQSPFMGILSHDDWCIISGSPERLFSLHNGTISTRPIAGTKKRGENYDLDNQQLAELYESKKENAEHAMLVDLMRNDLNQIALPGSVVVSEDRSVEFYSHVMHLVSNVEAQTTSSLLDIMRAMFPGGTITGAPKVEVMKAIAKLEIEARDAYTGSMGYISPGYGVDFNILIRSVYTKGNEAWTNAGAGIVIDSDPSYEWEEILKKAGALRDILAGTARPKMPRERILGPTLRPAKGAKKYSDARVLFVENQDSFSFNIVDALKGLGAEVIPITASPSTSTQSLLARRERAFKPTHIVLGPGPGNPSAMPWLNEYIKEAMNADIALLGICLGHQALGHYFGADICPIREPIHGKCERMKHTKEGLFRNIPDEIYFTRYHSLALKFAPRDFVVDAFSEDDYIMAIRHANKPLFGLQFHPESYLSQHGSLLFANFLEMR